MENTLMFCFVLFSFFVHFLSTNAADTPLAPALYVFGDSTVDAGNNNNLPTKAKANFLPYGMDFNNTPTGRFCNGMTMADYIATFLGLPFAPAYMNLSETERGMITTGLNYASGSCGILPDTGSSAGNCLNLDNQTDLFKSTIENGQPKDLAKSIFFLSMGINDYVFNYLRKLDKTTPDAFAEFLTDEFAKRLQKLYELGARKFLVNGIIPMGCMPALSSKTPHEGDCVEQINQIVALYNDKLVAKLQQLQSQLSGSLFTHSNSFKFFQELKENPETYGITGTNSSCLISNQPPCQDRSKFLFFDIVHTTQAANRVYASRCFNESSICTPLNIMNLASA